MVFQIATILDFYKEILTSDGIKTVNVHNQAKFCDDQSAANIWQFINFFQNLSHPPPWICFASVWAIHGKYMVVFITVKS